MSTGNKCVDAFLSELDARLKPDDPRQSPDSKARIEKMRPALELICRNDPEQAEVIIRAFMAEIDRAASLPLSVGPDRLTA